MTMFRVHRQPRRRLHGRARLGSTKSGHWLAETSKGDSTIPRIKKLRRASLDEVKITREGDSAIIENPEPLVGTMHLRIGAEVQQMSDIEILKSFNEVIAAQKESLRQDDNTVIEIPVGKRRLSSPIEAINGFRTEMSFAASSRTMRTASRRSPIPMVLPAAPPSSDRRNYGSTAMVAWQAVLARIFETVVAK